MKRSLVLTDESGQVEEDLVELVSIVGGDDALTLQVLALRSGQTHSGYLSGRRTLRRTAVGYKNIRYLTATATTAN